jgi:NAD(P)H-hydrate epimerase
MKLVTGTEMRAMDKLVIEKYGVPGIVLMENAASQIAAEIKRRYGSLIGLAISIVCGKGKNGGDGLAVARHLVVRYQADVTVWLVESMYNSSPETEVNLKAAKSYGIPVQSIDDSSSFPDNLKLADIIIDAILGTGVDGNARPAAAKAIHAVNNCGRPVVSIDIPSGLSDIGRANEPTVQATCTVTLALPKLGLFLYPGATLAGDVVVADISFPPAVTAASDIQTIAIEQSDISSWLPRRSPRRDSNKGKFGAVAILAGSPGFVGAANLASMGAARAGAGLVTLGVPQSIFEAIMARAADPIMTHAFPAADDGSFCANAVEDVLQFVQKRDSVAFGCGAGHGESAQAFARRFIAECDKPLVVDADALTILSMEKDNGASLIKSRKASTVLTPHPGEMARLLEVDTATVQNDRLAAVRDAAAKFGAVVVLKGQATLVASPDGKLAVNTTGNPGMSAGGSGDVLSGVIAALLAQIDDPWEASAAGVFIHGRAGDIAAREMGMAGMLATDLLNKLPVAIASCYD